MTGTPNEPQQLALDRYDPDGMEDREARLRAELDALDMAKIEARTDALDRVTRNAEGARVAGTALDHAVAAARGFGATWQQIADAAGLVKSAAWERWANR